MVIGINKTLIYQNINVTRAQQFQAFWIGYGHFLEFLKCKLIFISPSGILTTQIPHKLGEDNNLF